MVIPTLFLVLTAGVQAQQQQAPLPDSPAGCLSAVREFVMARQRAAATGGPVNVDVYRKVEEEKTVLARRCAAQFDPAALAPALLADLVALYAESNQPELAKPALDRALAARGLTDGQRADVLLQAVQTGLREPKSEARNARLEAYVARLDALPAAAAFDQQFNAHARMGGYYRGDDIDAGIVRHSTWMIGAARSFSPEQRKKFGATVVSGTVNLAEAWAGQGMNDRALELLRTAKKEWADYPRVDAAVDPVVARYSLVGKPAPPIEAPRWLNAPAGTTRMDMAGAVTFLEFTAHWCGPCKESYPGVKRLLARYGGRGFRVILATELYGYFESERGLSTAAEVEKDRAYFAKEGLDVPIAIAGQRPTPVRGTDGNYVITPGPNEEGYHVGGIPQIVLIDRRGRIRLIMVGYDDANEPVLAALVESLLAER